MVVGGLTSPSIAAEPIVNLGPTPSPVEQGGREYTGPKKETETGTLISRSQIE